MQLILLQWIVYYNMQLIYNFHLQSYGYSKLSKILKPGLVTFYIFLAAYELV